MFYKDIDWLRYKSRLITASALPLQDDSVCHNTTIYVDDTVTMGIL